MNIVTLRIIPFSKSEHDDDIVQIQKTETNHFKIVHRYTVGISNDIQRVYSTLFTRDQANIYISNLLLSLINDIDPFEQIQLDCSIYPSIMLSVESMKNKDILNTVYSMILSSIDGVITFNEHKETEEYCGDADDKNE
jgi:hypothetical protein